MVSQYRTFLLSRISEDILEQIIQDETEPQIHFASRVYLSKSTALCAAYRKYCNGLKKADCVLAAYREITVGGGLMEPIGEGRPLLTLQDLEARMVFTKCKPFQLASHGRQWIFGAYRNAERYKSL
uniref:Uncharacterized protein n=1 Tax=Anopheles maculatus TaxID=74869 RepID=A0A182SSE9_9DIPT